MMGFIAAGCGKPKCNDKTVYLTISFDAATSSADSLDVSVSLAGATAQETTVARRGNGNSSTLQVDFGGKYAAGASFDITVVASRQGVVVGGGTASHALDAGCTTLALSVTGAASEDLPFAIADMTTVKDASQPVDGPNVDLSIDHDLSVNPDLVPPADMVVTCSAPGSFTGAVISDFETGAQMLNIREMPNWLIVNDGTGTQSPAPGTAPVPAVPPSTHGSSTKAVHTTGSGFTNFAQLSATFFAGGYPGDAGAYSGLTFWAMGTTSNSNKVEVIVDPGAVEPVCGICTACYDGYIETFQITSSWAQYTLHWTDGGLAPIGYGAPQTPPLDPHSISAIAFSMSGSFDVWFDDVSFIP